MTVQSLPYYQYIVILIGTYFFGTQVVHEYLPQLSLSLLEQKLKAFGSDCEPIYIGISSVHIDTVKHGQLCTHSSRKALTSLS